MQPWSRPLVDEVLPDLAAEIRTGLRKADEGDLTWQFETLKVWGRCPCGDDFCSSFFTGPRITGRWSDDGEHRTIPLEVATGMVNLDVVDGVIRQVEVLDRPDVEIVAATFPKLDKPSDSDPDRI